MMIVAATRFNFLDAQLYMHEWRNVVWISTAWISSYNVTDN